MSPLTAFLTGLSTGGLTCLAVQGGLLFGLLARRKEDGEELKGWQRLLLPVSAFLIAKIAIYTVVGLGLGWLGAKIQLTQGTRLWLQTFAGTFMVVAGIRLIFPQWLPWLNINPPASVRRFIRNRSKSQALVAPAFLGLLTILIPCGTTQAMEVAAIATGSAAQAAAIMFAFTLGTAPLFLIIGVLARGTALLQSRLRWVAAALVIGLGVFSINGVLLAMDSPFSFQRQITAFQSAFLGNAAETEAAGPAQTSPVINVLSTGYDPEVVTVPAGQAVTLRLKTNNLTGCNSVFTIPKLRVQKNLPRSGETLVTATFPSPGQYGFSCSMGMFNGTITAI